MAWTIRSTPSDGALGAAACVSSGGRVVAIGNNTSSRLVYSDDGGITWLQSDPNDLDGEQGHDVCWSEFLGKFFAVGTTGTLSHSIILSSTDGITWVTETHPWTTTSILEGIASNEDDGILVTCGRRVSNGFDFMKSTNGTAWTEDLAGLTLGYAVEWFGDIGLWLLVGDGSVTILTSPDLTTWTGVSSDLDGSARCIGRLAGGDLLVGGFSSSTDTALVQSSDDGVSFFNVSTPFDIMASSGQINGIGVGAGSVLLGGQDATLTRVLARSADDGVSYALEVHPFDGGSSGVLSGFALAANWISVGKQNAGIGMIATTDTTPPPPTTSTQYQRIYGWRLNISDDALESVDPMLTSPQSGTNA